MFNFIFANIYTVVAGLAVAASVVFVIIKMLRDKKNGKTSCSCGCESCAMKDKCHVKRK